ARAELPGQGRAVRLQRLSRHGRPLRSAGPRAGSQAARGAAAPDPAPGDRARHGRAALGAGIPERDRAPRRGIGARPHRLPPVLRAVRGRESPALSAEGAPDHAPPVRGVPPPSAARARNLPRGSEFDRKERPEVSLERRRPSARAAEETIVKGRGMAAWAMALALAALAALGAVDRAAAQAQPRGEMRWALHLPLPPG